MITQNFILKCIIRIIILCLVWYILNQFFKYNESMSHFLQILTHTAICRKIVYKTSNMCNTFYLHTHWYGHAFINRGNICECIQNHPLLRNFAVFPLISKDFTIKIHFVYKSNDRFNIIIYWVMNPNFSSVSLN